MIFTQGVHLVSHLKWTWVEFVRTSHGASSLDIHVLDVVLDSVYFGGDTTSREALRRVHPWSVTLQNHRAALDASLLSNDGYWDTLHRIPIIMRSLLWTQQRKRHERRSTFESVKRCFEKLWWGRLKWEFKLLDIAAPRQYHWKSEDVSVRLHGEL